MPLSSVILDPAVRLVSIDFLYEWTKKYFMFS